VHLHERRERARAQRLPHSLKHLERALQVRAALGAW
jgi:hypothetical protein